MPFGSCKESGWEKEQRGEGGLEEEDYLFRQPGGDPMVPSTFTFRFKKILREGNLPDNLNVHSLRHPYVKPTTKKFASFLKFFRAAAIAARSCSIRYSWLMLPFQISPFLKSPA